METIHALSETEALSLIASQTPEVHPQSVSSSVHALVCHTLARMALMTVQSGRQGDLKRVKRYFLMADQLFQNGDESVKTAVSQLYVCSLLNALSKKNPLSQLLDFLLPLTLRSECQRQGAVEYRKPNH